MIPPPSEGNVFHYLPSGIGNPEMMALKYAWDAWQALAGRVMDQYIGDLNDLQKIPV